MKGSLPNRNSSGFTLIEVLLAFTLLAVIVVGASSLMMQAQRRIGNVQSQGFAESQLDTLLNDVKQDFFRRYIPDTGDPAAWQLLTAQSGQPAGCPGLVIRQHVPSAANLKNIRELHIFTQCTTGLPMTAPPNFMAANAPACPDQQHVQVRYQTWTTAGIGASPSYERLLPPPGNLPFAMALCFAAVGNSVQATGGALYPEGKEFRVVQKSLGMSLNDKNPLIELIR